MGRDLRAPTLEQVREARKRLGGDVLRTPLVKIDTGLDMDVWLKLENLQPIGAFKLRGALNLMRSLPPDELGEGVYTASAGNMAQGVAWAARQLGVHATAIVPDTAPAAKLEGIARLGASVVKVPYDEWWNTMQNRGRAGMRGTFVHPFADERVMAGNGTIALEILAELPETDVILVPWGGGGLTCGIAAAARAVKPDAKVFACEVGGAAPLSAALAMGSPIAIENRKSFVDGIGGRGVFPEIWPIARELVAGSCVVALESVAEAVRMIATQARCVAEGAGAAPLAAALSGRPDMLKKRVVCVVSGGNIDATALATILRGEVP